MIAMDKKICRVCGKPVKSSAAIYCSPQCRAESVKNYKPCVVCGTMFWCAPSEEHYTCSTACSTENRRRISISMEGNSDHIREQGRKYAEEHTAEKNPAAGHYGILTPAGNVIDVINLRHWVYNSGLFDNPDSAYNAFVHIISTLTGKRKNRCMYSYHGYTFAYFDKGNLLKSKANTKPKKYCKICGRELSGYRRSYCSDECAGTAHRDSVRAAYKKSKTGGDHP